MENQSRRWPLRPGPYLLALLALLAFWMGMWVANQRYPSEFDWRFAFWEWITCFVLSVYMVILSLAAQVRHTALHYDV
jgi:hypothetical protein